MDETTKKTYYLPRKLTVVFADWCKPGRDYSSKLAGAMLAWMTLEPAAREKIVALAYSGNIKKSTTEARKVLASSILDTDRLDPTTALSGLKNAIVAYLFLDDAEKATFDKLLADLPTLLAPDPADSADTRDRKTIAPIMLAHAINEGRVDIEVDATAGDTPAALRLLSVGESLELDRLRELLGPHEVEQALKDAVAIVAGVDGAAAASKGTKQKRRQRDRSKHA